MIHILSVALLLDSLVYGKHFSNSECTILANLLLYVLLRSVSEYTDSQLVFCKMSRMSRNLALLFSEKILIDGWQFFLRGIIIKNSLVTDQKCLVRNFHLLNLYQHCVYYPNYVMRVGISIEGRKLFINIIILRCVIITSKFS